MGEGLGIISGGRIQLALGSSSLDSRGKKYNYRKVESYQNHTLHRLITSFASSAEGEALPLEGGPSVDPYRTILAGAQRECLTI